MHRPAAPWTDAQRAQASEREKIYIGKGRSVSDDPKKYPVRAFARRARRPALGGAYVLRPRAAGAIPPASHLAAIARFIARWQC